MPKKRGGKRHRAKQAAEEVTNEGAEQVEELEAAEAPVSDGVEGARQKAKRGTHEGSKQKGNIQFEAFLTSTVEEIIKRGLLVISDQKCSRVVEKLIALLANFIFFQEGGRRPTFSSSESSEEERLQCRKRCLDSYLSLIRSIAPLAPSLATHPNGSHVMQTLLNTVPAVVEFEGSEHKESSEGGPVEQQTVEDFFLFMLGKIKVQEGGWLQTMCSATGTHIFRSIVRAAAGIDCLVPVEVAGRRTRRRTRKDREETLTPNQISTSLTAVLGKAGQNARLAKVPKSFGKELVALANIVADAIKADPYYLPFDVYAAPSLQVLMLVLHVRKQEEALGRLLDAIFCSSGDAACTEEFVQIADALVDSPTGSRVLEVAITLLTPERFQKVATQWLVKNINTLAQGRFGNFVLQKVLQAPVFQAAHLKQFVQALDFGNCLYASTSAVLWRCAEACRRLQSSYKEFAKKMFEAVGIRGGNGDADEKPAGHKKRMEAAEKENGQETAPAEVSNLRLQDVCTPSGCSIVMCLLKFPAAAIHPLSAGFKKFVKACRDCKVSVRKWKAKGAEPDIEIHTLLELMAKNKLASRLIQQIADPTTAVIQPAAVQYMIRSLLPFLPSLALDPVGGYVLTSIYSGATPESKKLIVEALLPIEEQLKAQNYSAYMKCEIYRFTKSKEEWQARQEKRTKTHNLFKDILATADVREEQETNDNLLSEAFTADPIAKQLVLDLNPKKTGSGKESKKKKRKKDGDEGLDVATDTQADAEAATHIEKIFLEAFDERQRKAKRRRRKDGTAEAEGSEQDDGPVKKLPQPELKRQEAEDDPTLDAALFFIEGTSSTMSKRELARRRKLEFH